MTRYELRPVGVYDRELRRVIGRGDSAWPRYLEWVAAGGVPAPQQPEVRAIEERRADVRAAANAARSRVLFGGVLYEGHRFDSDHASRTSVAIFAAGLEAGAVMLPGFTWRSAENVNVPMDADGMKGLAYAMLSHADICYRRSWQLKHLIDESDNPEAIDVESGWPQ